MSRRASANAVLLMFLGAFAAPGLAGADSGGAAPGYSGSPSGSTAVQPADVTATVSGNGVTFSARISALLRHQLRFHGRVPASSAGGTVLVERLDKQAGWEVATTGVAAADGSYTAVWRTNRTGRIATRVIAQPPSRTGSRIAASSPTLEVTVYRPAVATTYGPGFYGQQTACGLRLTAHTLGVAHRWLPCGTKVAIYFQGRTIAVPVIDRGPYANNADWDLTNATAHALGIGGTETIGAAPIGSNH